MVLLCDILLHCLFGKCLWETAFESIDIFFGDLSFLESLSVSLLKLFVIFLSGPCDLHFPIHFAKPQFALYVFLFHHLRCDSNSILIDIERFTVCSHLNVFLVSHKLNLDRISDL